MKRISTLFVVLALSLMSCIAQPRLYLPYFGIMGMHPDYQLSLTRLFKSYVESNARYSVVLGLQPEMVGALPEASLLIADAKAAGAAYMMTGEMNRLGEVLIVSFAMYEVTSGSIVWSDVLRAYNPDDLDPILQKVARAMGTDQKAAKAGDIYTVTEYDSRELKQQKAHYSFGLSVGAVYPFFQHVEDLTTAGFGVMATYDSRNIILDMKGETYFTGDPKVYFISLDALYPLNDENATPFLLGGLGLGGMNIPWYQDDNHLYWYDNHRNGGLMLFFGGGYLINRHSDVNLRLGARGMIPFFEVDDQLAPGILLNATINFGRR
ncbi:MAG TPA: hypothetical protein P5550_10440 [Bacteroidales bacterium]|nr:hypothetical protein [Bacteroidales bacterium]